MAQYAVPMPEPMAIGGQRIDTAAFVRVLVASATVAAGVIHLVMVPSHMGSWVTEGIGFAVAGWLQLGLAYAITMRARRSTALAVVAVNAVLIGLWLWSRTTGLPIGPHSGHAASVQLIDAATVAFEAVAILLSIGLLARRSATDGEAVPANRLFVVAPLIVVAATTSILASPSARNHSHDSHANHSTSAATGTAEASSAHVHTDAEAPAAAVASASVAGVAAEPGTVEAAHTHPAEPAPAPANALAATAPEPAAAAEPAGHVHNAPANGATPAGAAAAPVDDKGWSLLSNGTADHHHQAGAAPEPLDAMTTALLAKQLGQSADMLARFPTIADAEAAGFRRSGGFSPGLGTHYGMRFGQDNPVGTYGAIEGTNLANPMLIYNGTDPDSRLVGFMYNAYGTADVPQGFAGGLDTWHKHENVCIKWKSDGTLDALGSDSNEITREWCEAQGRCSSRTPATWSTCGTSPAGRTRSACFTNCTRRSPAPTAPTTPATSPSPTTN